MDNSPSPLSMPLSAATGAVDEQYVTQKLSLLYTENAKVAATFWEWRHKLMDRFFAALVAVFAAAGWLYQRQELRRLLFIPLLLGGIYSIVSFLMDRVNKKILLGCYEIGKELEQQLGPTSGAYGRILERHKSVNYSFLLLILYRS